MISCTIIVQQIQGGEGPYCCTFLDETRHKCPYQLIKNKLLTIGSLFWKAKIGKKEISETNLTPETEKLCRNIGDVPVKKNIKQVLCGLFTLSVHLGWFNNIGY